MKEKFLLLMAIFGSLYARAQHRTFLGFEAGGSSDHYSITDPGHTFHNTLLPAGYLGLHVRQELGKRFFVETGFLGKEYDLGYEFPSGASESSNAFDAWLIPLRFGASFNLSRQKVFFQPLVGYVQGINRDNDFTASQGFGREESGGEIIEYTEVTRSYPGKAFPLVQFGAGLAFTLFRSAQFCFAANYYAGWKRLIQTDLQYHRGSSLYQASLLGRGSMTALSASLQYPVSNFWKKR